MPLKPFLTFALLSTLTLSFIGCQQNPERYLFEENKAIELLHDQDSIATYGVFSDIHGETEKLKVLSKVMQERGVEGFIILGDTPQNDVLRSGGRQLEGKDDTEEMIEAYTILAKTEMPVLILPGNHERKPEYQAAIKEVTAQYKNMIDLTQYRIVDGDDVDFISLPGYQIQQSAGQKFIPDDGYFADAETIAATGKLSQSFDDAVILLTHGPPKTSPDSNSPSISTYPHFGPGTLYNDSDVGDESTRNMMLENNLHFALSGHIHEAGGIAATLEGKSLPENQWTEELILNVGSLEDWTLLDGKKSQGMAAIVTIDGTKIKYEIIKLK